MMNSLRNLAGLALLFLAACHPQDRPQPSWEISSQSLEVQGKKELLFTLPENFQWENPVISRPAALASAAELFLSDEGRWTLRYQSADGKSADYLSIDSEGGHKQQSAHPDQCGGGGNPLFGHPRGKGERKSHFRLNLLIKVTEAGDEIRKLSSRKLSHQ